ncbi:hypothetical protein [Lichenifustis flavocetrariae]|nr:hypothetical protein [Lichenifustis flavocetrariae]
MAEFTHPLAREAKVWPLAGLQGAPHDILVVITTLDLERTSKRFKADKVQKLTAAARAWIDETKVASDVLLINRPRDWSY